MREKPDCQDLQKHLKEGRRDCWSGESEKKEEETNECNEESLNINKNGKTRKDTRWKRGEFIVVERVRKQSENEDGGMRVLRES